MCDQFRQGCDVFLWKNIIYKETSLADSGKKSVTRFVFISFLKNNPVFFGKMLFESFSGKHGLHVFACELAG
ncbi:hypothetical protein KKC88_04210 [Patescibacteria group bacterium]|nr:hypothetical protein [Patescibacteria group bacterium]MBU1673805.1 hypothetical protein [Patescibacteria group bacterium]MBU1963773.1 hypothetical protein [Patescibacteria group bacterium]